MGKRKQICDAMLALDASGMNRGASGNASLRDGDHMLITPSGVPPRDITPDLIARIPLNGSDEWEGKLAPSVEWHFHRDLLLARQLAPRFGGVMQKADEHYTMQDEDLTIPRPIEFCTGSFAAIRTDVFKTIGGFDPEYFMYVEDADLTQRALRQGLVYLLPQFTATHAWHRDPMRDAGKFKMQLKSMGRYFKKWGIGKGNV